MAAARKREGIDGIRIRARPYATTDELPIDGLPTFHWSRITTQYRVPGFSAFVSKNPGKAGQLTPLTYYYLSSRSILCDYTNRLSYKMHLQAVPHKMRRLLVRVDNTSIEPQPVFRKALRHRSKCHTQKWHTIIISQRCSISSWVLRVRLIII